jgi:hypothetical protein
MTSCVEAALVKDEKIVHVGHISLWSMWHLFALGLLLIAAAGTSQAPVAGISAPMEFRKAFIEAQERARAGT